MIRPKTRVYYMCSDIIPISAFLKEQKEAKENPLLNPTYNNDRTQTNSIRFYQEHSSEDVNRRPFRRFSVFNGKYTR